MQSIRLLPPAPVPGIHSLAEFFLFGVLVLVLLDGVGAVTGYLGDVSNRGVGVQFAGDERTPCRVPRHFLVDIQNLASLIQCPAYES